MQRILAWAGPVDEQGWQTRLAWFRRIALMHVATRSYLSLWEGEIDPAELLLRRGLVVVALVGCVPRCALWATRIAALLVFAEIAVRIPHVANHLFLEFVLLTLMALLDDRDEPEGALLLQGLRCTIGVFFFYTGLQKLLWGYWFDGQLLAFMAATEERFATIFQFVIPTDELARLHSYNTTHLERPGVWKPWPDAGPYRVDSIAFVALSNVIYLGEMTAGIGMLVRRVRVPAALAAMGLVVGIEAGARELTFGALMLAALLLFVPGARTRQAFPLFAAFYLYLVAARLGWVPMFRYAAT